MLVELAEKARKRKFSRGLAPGVPLISIGDSTFIRLTFDRVFLPDTNSVKPWAKLDAGTQKVYFNRFGADAEPPFGLTLETTDHMLGDQWIARWNPGAIGTRIIFR